MQKAYLEYNFGYIEHVRNITVVMPDITSVIFQIWLLHITTSYSSRLTGIYILGNMSNVVFVSN